MIVKCNHSVLECPKLWTDKGIWKIPCCKDWKEIIWRRKLWKVHWKSSNARTKSSRFLQYQSHFWCMWRRWDGDLWSTHIRKYAHKNNLNRIFGIDRLYWISTFEVAQGDSLAIVGWLVKCYYCVQQHFNLPARPVRSHRGGYGRTSQLLTSFWTFTMFGRTVAGN
jgi:hypothetical protein